MPAKRQTTHPPADGPRRRRRDQPSRAVPPKAQTGKAAEAGQPDRVRLQRALATAGYGSRRQCELLILEGRVEVDGQVVDQLGTTIDPARAKVLVDGTSLKPPLPVYYIVNKPPGVVTTHADPAGRPRVIDLVPPEKRVFPVGRLDRASEGLILLTNDGELAQRLAHPRYSVTKVYRVIVAGNISAETMKQMRQGIYIAEGRVQVEGARIIKKRGKSSELEITLKEGKNREIRRILARLGHKVQSLKRIAVGTLRLGDLPRGAHRQLTTDEVRKLRAAIAPQQRTGEAADEPRRGGTKARHTTGRSRSPARPPAAANRPQPRSAAGSAAGTVIGADPPPEKPARPRAAGKRQPQRSGGQPRQRHGAQGTRSSKRNAKRSGGRPRGQRR